MFWTENMGSVVLFCVLCSVHCTYRVHYAELTVYAHYTALTVYSYTVLHLQCPRCTYVEWMYSTLHLQCTLHCTYSVHYTVLTVYTTLHLPCTLYLPKYRPCRESSHRNSNHPSPKTIPYDTNRSTLLLCIVNSSVAEQNHFWSAPSLGFCYSGVQISIRLERFHKRLKVKIRHFKCAIILSTAIVF